nr:MAG TPA: hemolysin [Caudoviricetes sp.]
MNTEQQLYQKLGKMEADIGNINKLVNEVNQKVDTYNTISQRVTVLEERAIDRSNRLHKLEDNQAKIVWAIVTAVIGAVLKFVVIDGGIHK